MSVRKVQLAFDGAVVAEVPETPLEELPKILETARKAAGIMAGLTRGRRAEILFAASNTLLAQKEDLARTITLESGKPIRESRVEVERAASTLWFSGEEAHRLAGEEVPLDAADNGAGRMAYTMRRPVGVVAAITPFNFPLNLAMHKVGPAIAAGNAIVLKPASATPLSAMHAASILVRCGLPAEALQVVVGPGATIGDALVAAPEVNYVSFTGSGAVGHGLPAKAGMKRVGLELGNNSAVLVLDDADLDVVVPACVAGAFGNSGQSCISVQRIYVGARIRDRFVEQFAEATRQLRIGHPLEAETEISCLIHEDEAKRVQAWIGEAVREGATLHTGGGRNLATLQPAVLSQVAPTSKLYREEAFGPVALVNSFGSLEEGIAMVNDSRYGLQAGVFTNDLRAAWRVVREIDAGGVMVNDVSNFRVDLMPYGGTKESGLGKEGPRYAIEQMTETKLVSWRVS